jgi:hypothetical protein
MNGGIWFLRDPHKREKQKEKEVVTWYMLRYDKFCFKEAPQCVMMKNTKCHTGKITLIMFTD